MSRVHALLARLGGARDALFALAVLALVLLLVAPMPPPVLDACLALNLALSATILVVTLFARDALRFASFPTLLLLTTLFRLALEVTSTRLVLSRGDAGRIVEAFGRVVVQGNCVVGAVVFAILTLVQLLVVARGAERVAEVAARFALDALPGKQMAIDADLRAGALEAAEARRRRRALERESQLYGAMDGALKFVKGDAIAGVAIAVVNVVGGLAAGAMRGMDLGAAARRYTILAIGDGLAAQVPALLLALSAGVAVTRVASEEDGGSLAGEIGRQLLADPRALGAVAILLAALGLAPGLPAAPFLALAAGAGTWAFRLGRTRHEPGRAAAEGGGPAPAPPAFPDEWEAPAPVALALAADLLEEARAGDGRSVRDGLTALRERLWRDLGVRLPAVAVRPGALAPGGWALLVDEVPAIGGAVPAGEVLVLASPDDVALVGIPCTPVIDASTGRRAAAVAATDRVRAAALGAVRERLDRVLANVGAALEREAHRFVGVQEAQVLLDALEAAAPALVREAGRQLPPALLAEVLRRLVEEGVSVRPLRTILESMLEAGGAPRGAHALAEACRRALRRHIGHRCAAGGAVLALLLDPRAEALVREGTVGEVPAVDPAVASGLLDGLVRELSAVDGAPVLFMSADIRRLLRSLVAA
ncbi:MAG TPA: flagellar biosynthesis protein FlhA [Anaeromyxobacteraceae bacterium]|nr:flagellar biosynthesis protein FlhA [Anaeromyxobacteraceae bacterium]